MTIGKIRFDLSGYDQNCLFTVSKSGDDKKYAFQKANGESRYYVNEMLKCPKEAIISTKRI